MKANPNTVDKQLANFKTDEFQDALLLQGFSSLHVPSLCACIKSGKEINWLSIEANDGLSAVDISLISDALSKNSTLKSLALQIRLNDHTISELANSLTNHPSITRLDLGHNQITDIGANILARALKNHPTLDILNISHNQISEQGLRALFEAFKEKDINIYQFGNDISPLELEKIYQDFSMKPEMNSYIENMFAHTKYERSKTEQHLVEYVRQNSINPFQGKEVKSRIENFLHRVTSPEEQMKSMQAYYQQCLSLSVNPMDVASLESDYSSEDMSDLEGYLGESDTDEYEFIEYSEGECLKSSKTTNKLG